VITLTLLHPLQPVAVQSWTFKTESKIRIGRSTNNEVVLYSAVVSRHHVEIRNTGQEWEVVNLGANGTYIDGKRITNVPVTDGTIVRLASSGPKILIKIESESTERKLADEQDDSFADDRGSTRQPKGSKDTLIS
jgi:pSer/pThr/pTyr-binding forkhead associated (FHA) protein